MGHLNTMMQCYVYNQWFRETTNILWQHNYIVHIGTYREWKTCRHYMLNNPGILKISKFWPIPVKAYKFATEPPCNWQLYLRQLKDVWRFWHALKTRQASRKCAYSRWWGHFVNVYGMQAYGGFWWLLFSNLQICFMPSWKVATFASKS